MKKQYIITSRYGDRHKLVQIGEYEYEFKFADGFYRGVLNEDGTIHAIDPSGGPFMTVGCEVIPGYEIESFIQREGKPPSIKLKKK